DGTGSIVRLPSSRRSEGQHPDRRQRAGVGVSVIRQLRIGVAAIAVVLVHALSAHAQLPVTVGGVDPTTGHTVSKTGSEADNATRTHTADADDITGANGALGALNNTITVALAGQQGASLHIPAATLVG